MAEQRTSLPMKLAIGVAVVLAMAGAGSLYLYLQRATEKANAQQEDRYKQDASEIRAVDPKLITYKQVRQIPLPFDVPTAIAVDGAGRIIVGGDKGIRIIDGEQTKDVDLGAQPNCLAAREDGSILVGFARHVAVLDRTGKKVADWPEFSKESILTSIAASGDDIWVADAGMARVVRCDPTGRIAPESECRPIVGMTIYSNHLDVAVGPDGLVWVVDPGQHRVQSYKRDGRPLPGRWGKNGPGIDHFVGCCNPADMAILPDGRFVTAEKGAARVKVSRISGELDGVVADVTTLGLGLESFDLAVDGDGRVFVLDSVGRCVRVFAPKERS